MAGYDHLGSPVITPQPMKWWKRVVVVATMVAVIIGVLLLLDYIY